MTAPATAVLFLLAALGIGGALGLFYGFLRPLRPRLTALADLIFVAAALWGWIYLTFGICGGDCRLGCTLAMAAGGMVWEMTLGRIINPIFFRFWQGIFLPARKIRNFFQKIYNFLLASGKKWVTMVRTMIRSGGVAHGKRKPSQAGNAKNQPHHKSRRHGRGHPVRGGAGGAVRLH